MNSLKFTLLADGGSDRALVPVLVWLLKQSSSQDFTPQWAELSGLRKAPRTLEERLRAAVSLYPCDLLFVHRDAERESREMRAAQIRESLRVLPGQPAVCVVPVRMLEAWLLFDEAALRRAAGNPRGYDKLDLPALDRLERVPDPKQVLFDLFRKASGLRPGRLHGLSPAARRSRLAGLIEDFSPLRRLPAFRALEKELQALLAERSWT